MAQAQSMVPPKHPETVKALRWRKEQGLRMVRVFPQGQGSRGAQKTPPAWATGGTV